MPETFEPVFFVLPNMEIPFKMHQQKVLVASDFGNSGRRIRTCRRSRSRVSRKTIVIISSRTRTKHKLGLGSLLIDSKAEGKLPGILSSSSVSFMTFVQGMHCMLNFQ